MANTDLDDLWPTCRDDKCKVVGVHRAHPMPPDNRRKVLDACPKCAGGLIRMPKTRGRCAVCPWRGSIALPRSPEPSTQERDPVTHRNLDKVRGERYCTLTQDRKRLEPLVAQISEVLQTKPMRNAEVLQTAKIDDYRAGEDAIWELVQQGRVRVEADSTLTWVASNEEKRPRGAGAATRGPFSRQPKPRSRKARSSHA